jgi:Ca-activated chloride channel homolog
MPSTPVSLSISTDYTRVSPGEARLHVVVELEAHGTPADTRPRLLAVFALDVSGSMMGPPLEQVARSVDRLVDLLAPDDQLGVVAFADNATEVAPLTPLTPEAKRVVCSRVVRLQADGQTNVQAALRVAHRLFPTRAPDTRHAILLLSDGQPNVGATTGSELRDQARAFRPDVCVSVLGYGTHHDEAVLSAISEGGGGVYRFISDPAVCQVELAQALGSQVDVVAEALELLLVPEPGVEIVRLVGAPQTRFSADGLVVPLPDMVDRARRLVVAQVRTRLDAQRLGGALLRARLHCRRAGSTELCELEARASVDIGAGAPARDPAAWGKVLLARADEVRAEARAMADRGQFEGAAAALRALIAEIEAAPGYVPGAGSPLDEGRELLLDEAMAMERRPSAEAYGKFKKSTLGSMLAGDGANASSKPLSASSLAYGDAAAGLFPEAHLVVLRGPNVGHRYPLAAQNTLGRTTSADVVIPSANVSRRHADIFALEGEFWIADLGSTNTTCVNGQPIASAPHKLAPGDVIALGGLELRYEQKLD